MSQTDYWFIPKRANVHQMVALLAAIIDRNYDGTTWNPNKQDNLNLSIRRLGATKSGRKIANQGMRTLLASAQYLGFVYLDTTTTPTTLRITKVGCDFYNKHESELIPMPKLTKSLTINKSSYFLYQMIKLQITNPIILSSCQNILTFPFRAILTILKTLDYLDKEEIAMYVFKIKDMTEIDFKIREIQIFRRLDTELRNDLVESFKQTTMGNITLAQAPSSAYFMQFCEGTGVITKHRVSTNGGYITSAISINSEYLDYVNTVLDFYSDTEPYDFNDDLHLWIEYIGDPQRYYPPYLTEFFNTSNEQIYFELYDNKDILKEADILDANDSTNVPVFHDEDYKINTYKCSDGSGINSVTFLSEKNYSYDVSYNLINSTEVTYKYMSKRMLIDEIMSHSISTNFNTRMTVKLNILNKRLGVNKLDNKNLRGAFYEFLFNLFLNRLKDDGIVDEVIWNGHIGKFNLPVPAPGGKLGTPDIIFVIDNTHYVLELTTIKSKSGQERAECYSVPDHIRLYKNNNTHSNDVKGIFCAPIIHYRNITGMNAVLSPESIPFNGITDENLLELMNVSDRDTLISNLNSLF